MSSNFQFALKEIESKNRQEALLCFHVLPLIQMNQAIVTWVHQGNKLKTSTLIKGDKKLPVRKYEKVENLTSSKEWKIILDMKKMTAGAKVMNSDT